VTGAERILTRGDAAAERAAWWLRDLVCSSGLDLDERPRARWGSLNSHHPAAGDVCGVFPRDGHAIMVIEHGAAVDGFDDVFDERGGQIAKIVMESVPDARAARIVDAVIAEVALRAAP
jgi:hypothetical protein